MLEVVWNSLVLVNPHLFVFWVLIFENMSCIFIFANLCGMFFNNSYFTFSTSSFEKWYICHIYIQIFMIVTVYKVLYFTSSLTTGAHFPQYPNILGINVQDIYIFL